MSKTPAKKKEFHGQKFWFGVVAMVLAISYAVLAGVLKFALNFWVLLVLVMVACAFMGANFYLTRTGIKIGNNKNNKEKE